MTTLYLCGAGNSEGVRLARRVGDAEGRWDRIALLDDDPARHGHRLLDVEVVGPFSLLDGVEPGTAEAVNLVARTTAGRRAARGRITAWGVPLVPLVAPDVDSWGVELEGDVTVYPHATLGPESVVGEGSVVFMGAVVGHESVVGPGCVLASNAVLNARVRLGAGVYVGTNATVIPEITVGPGATIGAGSVVVEDVPAGATVMGVPARLLSGAPASSSAGGSVPWTVGHVERLLCRAWAGALGVEAVDPRQNVFDMGASSRLALQVGERLRREGCAHLDPVDLFRFPRVRDLARHLASRANGPAADEVAGPFPRRGSPRRDGGAGARTRSAAGVERPPAAATGGPGADGTPGQAGPGDALVAAVARVFGRVLHDDEVGPDSDFFQLGGDAAGAGRACRELQELTGEAVCHVEIARHPTPRELAEHIHRVAGQPPACPVQWVASRMMNRRGSGVRPAAPA